MMRRGIAAAVVAFVVTAPVAAQDYPTRPIRFMIGFAPGGSSDLVSRALAERLAPRLGQTIVPDNRVGASGVVANETVAKAPPDGHTMVLLTGGHPVAAAVMSKLPYDALESFSMVSTVTSYPMMVTVAADSPMKTLGDLIARARANPDKVTYAVSGPGSLHHLLGELINIEAKTSMVSVPYRGAAAAMVDLLGGRIDAMVETATFSLPRCGAARCAPLRFPPAPATP
jgi:tripartite-type tricarboxylate transporter receptor subunit TctC